MKDFLDQLADLEVREPPREFNRRLHERLNRTLMVQHVIDFFVGAAAWAVGQFFLAVVGWLRFTLTGRFK